MAFPAVAGTPTTLATTTNDTTPTLTYPTGIAANELLICILAIDGNGAASSGWPAGWANLHTTLSGTAVRFETHWKRAAGTESGSFDVTTASEMHGAWMGRISGCHTSTDPAIGTAATGTSANPNSPSLNPANWDVEDTLWLAVCGLDYATALTVTTWPTDYSLIQTLAGGSNAGAAAVAIAGRNLAAASDDPAAWTFSGSEQWVAQTIAIRPAAGANIDRTATDGVTYADAPTRLWQGFRSASDARDQADVATRQAVLARSVADARGQADAAVATKVVPRTTADAITLADVPTRLVALLRSTSDASGHSDVALRAITLARSTADAVTRSDAATRLVALLRSATDATTYVDVATQFKTGGGAIARTAADALGLTDAATRSVGLARSVAESVTRSDAAVRVLGAARSAGDALAASDAATRALAVARAIGDALALADGAVRTIGNLVLGSVGRIPGGIVRNVFAAAGRVRGQAPAGAVRDPAPDGAVARPTPGGSATED